jgi:hypothetical protein
LQPQTAVEITIILARRIRHRPLAQRTPVVTSDAGLLNYRELDDALGLTDMASEVLAEARTGKNGRRASAGLLRQTVFGRLAGYEAVVHLSNPAWKIFKPFFP